LPVRRADQKYAFRQSSAQFGKLFGSFKKAIISGNSSFASSTPAHLQSILTWFSVSSFARLLPNDMALPPPPCIWRMKKIQTPTRRMNGNQEMKMENQENFLLPGQ
jgi:hypothetical protein